MTQAAGKAVGISHMEVVQALANLADGLIGIDFLKVDMKSVQGDSALGAGSFSESKRLVGTANEVGLEAVNGLNSNSHAFLLGPGVNFFHASDGIFPLFFRRGIRIHFSDRAWNNGQDLTIQF